MEKRLVSSTRKLDRLQQQVSNQEKNSVDYCVNLLDKKKWLFFVAINRERLSGSSI